MDMPPEVRVGLISAGVVVIIAVLLLVFGDRPELAAAIRRLVASGPHNMSSSDDAPATPAAGTEAVHVPVPRTSTDAGTTSYPVGGTDVAAPDTDAAEAGTDDAETPRISTRLSDAETVALLATQRGKDGKHRYSANQIHTLVGGSRADVLAQVRALRDGAPAVFRPLSDEQQQLRAQLQLDRPRS